MGEFKPPEYRWGSIFGLQDNGMVLFNPGGSNVRLPLWLMKIIRKMAVNIGIYKGIRSKSEV